MKTIDSSVKFEPIVKGRSWGQAYSKTSKKRKRYEDKRQAKVSERYKENKENDDEY